MECSDKLPRCHIAPSAAGLICLSVPGNVWETG